MNIIKPIIYSDVTKLLNMIITITNIPLQIFNILVLLEQIITATSPKYFP